MADIENIDAAVPIDGERIRLGAQRIRETRTKLNEVVDQQINWFRCRGKSILGIFDHR